MVSNASSDSGPDEYASCKPLISICRAVENQEEDELPPQDKEEGQGAAAEVEKGDKSKITHIDTRPDPKSSMIAVSVDEKSDEEEDWANSNFTMNGQNPAYEVA